MAWCESNGAWLDPYVEFTALRDLLDHAPWPTWEPGLRDRDPERVGEVLAPLAREMLGLRFEQWVFASQWAALRAYAAERGVLFFGDLPIFVSHDSADVWSSRELFELDDDGQPITVAGCPPDYFAADGQRWNNPHYDWDGDGRRRVRVVAARGSPGSASSSTWCASTTSGASRRRGTCRSRRRPRGTGSWVKAPGREVLAALVEAAGPGTLVAEDLGVITPEVDALRIDFGLPGMKVLQFAFDGEADNPYLPERHGEESVVYTGTHDNDTTVGWWAEEDEETHALVRAQVPVPDEPMPWALIRLAMSSTARLAVVPAQDLLGLGSESRMNTPGTDEGNWAWRAAEDDFDAALAERTRDLVAESHG